MHDDGPFLDAIKESPENLSIRLVYADWLEEQGDPRGEYLRVDGQLHDLIGSLAMSEWAAEPRVRRLRARLAKLAKSLHPKWVAIFDALQPTAVRCRACRKFVSHKEAIDTDPRTYRKMKTSRYCKLCYEDAVRLRLHRGNVVLTRRGSAITDYHGGTGGDS